MGDQRHGSHRLQHICGPQLDGVVVDYINLLFMQFAVFNFADICVCVGVGLWVLEIFLEELHGGAKEQ